MTKKTPAKSTKKKAKTTSKKMTKKAEVPIVKAAEPEEAPALSKNTLHRSKNTLQITLSESLQKKLREQSEEEGIGVAELVTELLSEGVVVRAWEIVERRVHMRSGAGQQVPNGNSGNNGNSQRNGRRHNNRRGGMSNSRYQNIMDDRASFLEYVRNQERQGR